MIESDPWIIAPGLRKATNFLASSALQVLPDQVISLLYQGGLRDGWAPVNLLLDVFFAWVFLVAQPAAQSLQGSRMVIFVQTDVDQAELFFFR